MGRPVDAQIQERKEALGRDRAEHQDKLKSRVDALVTREVQWTPTLINRDTVFAARAPVVRIAAMEQASQRRLNLLAKFLDNAAAMTALCERGELPAGLSDHFVHPLRGGGQATAENYCLVTTPLHDQIKATKIGPIIQKAYGEPLSKLEQRSGRLLARGMRRLPSEMRKRIDIPVPGFGIGINEDDIAWRDQSVYLASEALAIGALKDARKKLSQEKGHTNAPKLCR